MLSLLHIQYMDDKLEKSSSLSPRECYHKYIPAELETLKFCGEWNGGVHNLRKSTQFDSFWRNISKKTFSLSEMMLLKLRKRVCQNAVSNQIFVKLTGGWGVSESPSKRHPHFPQTKAEIGARPFVNQ